MAHGDITHIEIPVSDFAKGAEFYSEGRSFRILTATSSGSTKESPKCD